MFFIFCFFFHIFPFCFFLLNKKFLLLFFLSCLSFKHISLLALVSDVTTDVSSEVGAPWRRGVLTTWGLIAGVGLDLLLGREHDSTPQSGVEAPRLLKRSLSRFHCRRCFRRGHSTRCPCQHPRRRIGNPSPRRLTTVAPFIATFSVARLTLQTRKLWGGSAVSSTSGQLLTSAEIELVRGLSYGALDPEFDAEEDAAREMYSQSDL